MQARTDIDVLSGEPVAVVLGGKEFLLKPQPRGRSAKWAREYLTRMQNGEQLLDPKNVDKFGDLFYSYSPDIAEAKDWIEEHATQVEFAKALSVMGALMCGPLAQVPLNTIHLMTGGLVSSANGTKDTLTD